MSGKGKSINPDKRANPAQSVGPGEAVGKVAQWNGLTWVPIDLARAIQSLIDTGTIVVGSGSGSVTSVGLAAPKEFSISGSPVTGSGTITETWINQSGNTVLASPADGSSGQPEFRALVAADLSGASPDAFSFTPQTGVTPMDVITSNTVTLSGSGVWPVVIRGAGSPQLSLNGGAWVTEAVAFAGDTLQVRMTASSSGLTAATATVYAANTTSNFVTTTANIDLDAEAFITATGITDATQKAAIRTLCGDLKAASIWTKLIAVYPFVGGTATTHKYNLKDPRDLDAAYRLTFSGSWTHSSTGILPDGVTGSGTAYADTHFLCDTTVWTAASGSFGCYTRTSSADQSAYDMGATNNTDDPAYICIPRYGLDRNFVGFGTSTYPHITDTDGRGLYATNRLSSSVTEGYRNGSLVQSGSDTVTTLSLSLFIGACHKPAGGPNPDRAVYFATKEQAFAFIGMGLTATEHANLYTAVQAFETTLSRQI